MLCLAWAAVSWIGPVLRRAFTFGGLLDIAISVVVPVKNEAENIRPLIGEIAAVLDGREPYEIVVVDDGSDDATPAVLAAARKEFPTLRALRHAENCGQSAAIRSGVHAARGTLIVTLDGDGQNDPADIPLLIERYRIPEAGMAPAMVAGMRLSRRDSFSKRMASRIGNGVRRWFLKDGTADTGCGLKLFPRSVFLALPYFDHMHRFLPALVQREGLRVAFVGVSHRPRRAGRSNYTNLGRLADSVGDLFGVMWLRRRCRRPSRVTEL